MELSIVLTVYNKEQYLNRALDSLLHQKETNNAYEIIVVNDGSTDNSLRILEQYASIDSRIKIINQSNMGLSMARNNGIDLAQGKYVWCVDADDIVSSYAVSLICKAAEFCADVMPIYAQTEGVESIRNKIPPCVKNGVEVLLSQKWQQCGVFYVFKKDFLLQNKLHFYPGIFHEDAEFTPRMLYAAKSIKVIPEILYTVIHEPNSITGVPRTKRAFDCLLVAERLNEFVINVNERKTQIGRVFDTEISMIINNALDIIVRNPTSEQKRLNNTFFENRSSFLSPMFSSNKMKYIIEAMLFKIFPKHYVFVYKMIQILNYTS